MPTAFGGGLSSEISQTERKQGGLLLVSYDAGSATAQTFLLKQQAQNPDLATATSVGGVSMSTWSGIDKVSSGSGLVNVGPILLDLPKVVSTQDYTHLR